MASELVSGSSRAMLNLTASASPSLHETVSTSTSTFGLFGWVILSTVRVIPSILYFVITTATITLPTWIYRVLSISLTVTVNFSTLAFLVVAVVSTISYFVRYRFHTYARLPAEPPRKEPEVEVFPETQAGDSKPGLSSYIDEFLSAIKVFGYLERYVVS
jgi:lysophospholipid hydrolase